MESVTKGMLSREDMSESWNQVFNVSGFWKGGRREYRPDSRWYFVGTVTLRKEVKTYNREISFDNCEKSSN